MKDNAVLYSRFIVRRFARFGPLFILILFAGCVYLPNEVEVAAPPPVPAESPPDIRPAPPKPVHATPREPARTAVLLSDDIQVFAAVAEEIKLRLGEDHVTIHNLDGEPANADRVTAEIADAEADQLVAVGLLAATVGRQTQNKPMVFCKVFNYQDHDLISRSSKGVNLLPPFDIQLQAWTDLAPGLQSVGIIAGPNHDALVAEIRRATDKLQIKLSVRTVHSDKEALITFKRLTPEIQGLWLLPDNRILSPNVVREIMSYSAKHRQQIVVFSSNLLSLGALMSVTSNDRDVADQVLSRLEGAADAGTLAGPDMMPLMTMELEINPEVARHLGLIVSEQVARDPVSD